MRGHHHLDVVVKHSFIIINQMPLFYAELYMLFINVSLLKIIFFYKLITEINNKFSPF